LREFKIDQFLDHRRYTGILPGCGCSLKCERQEEAIEHDFYKVMWVPVWVNVDEKDFKLTFSTEWLTKREIIVSSSSKSKRMSVAEKEREREKLKTKVGKKKWAKMEERGSAKTKLTETEEELKHFEQKREKYKAEVTARMKRKIELRAITPLVIEDDPVDDPELEEEVEDDDDGHENEAAPNPLTIITANSTLFLADLFLIDFARYKRVVAYSDFIKGVIETKRNSAFIHEVEPDSLSKRRRVDTSELLSVEYDIAAAPRIKCMKLSIQV
jgi:hypothetical protein